MNITKKDPSRMSFQKSNYSNFFKTKVILALFLTNEIKRFARFLFITKAQLIKFLNFRLELKAQSYITKRTSTHSIFCLIKKKEKTAKRNFFILLPYQMLLYLSRKLQSCHYYFKPFYKFCNL